MTRVRVKTLLFSVASITNNHKLGDLKQQVVNLLYFWRSEVQNLSQWAEIKISAELSSLPKLQERIHGWPLAVYVAAGTPWLASAFTLHGLDLQVCLCSAFMLPSLLLCVLPLTLPLSLRYL